MNTAFFRFHLPAILWAAAVLILTLLPADALPPTPVWKLLSFDTFCHAVVFTVLFLLTIRSFYYSYGNPKFYSWAFTVSFFLCLFFGIIIELLQTVMKLGRHGEISDGISDLIGILIGAVIFNYMPLRFRNL